MSNDAMPLKAVLFTYNDGKQRLFQRVQTVQQLPLPVPGWQLAISETHVFFVPAVGVRDVEVKIEDGAQ